MSRRGVLRSGGPGGPGWSLRLLVALLLGIAVTGCARIPEPGSTTAHDEQPQVVIGVGSDRASEVVARLYAGVLAARGTDVRLDLDARQRQRSLADLDAGALTLVPESMGELVDHLEPQWRAATGDVDADATFVELSRALPIGLSVADFAESATLPRSATSSPWPAAEGASGAGADKLPNNVVPLFRTGELDATQVMALNVIAGELTTADVVEMLEQIDTGRPVGEVTGSWVAERLA